MTNKPYKTPKNEPMTVNEPATAYIRQPATTGITSSNQWNPNIPFQGTQKEWWNHFHRIEEGEFMTIEEADKEFEEWKTEYLANRI